jgi:hypothetical protein
MLLLLGLTALVGPFIVEVGDVRGYRWWLVPRLLAQDVLLLFLGTAIVVSE